MTEQIVNLSTLADVSCVLGQIDALQLDGVEIWRRNNQEEPGILKFVQSDLLMLPDDGNTGSLKDIVAFKNNLVIVKGSNLYHTSDFENWTTVILQGTPNLVRVCNNKLFYCKGDYVYYTEDLINFVTLPKFSGVASNDAFFELYWDEKDQKYRFWEYYYRHDSSDLVTWKRYSIGDSGNVVKRTSNTYYDGTYYYSVPLNDSNYYYIYSSLTSNTIAPLATATGAGATWKFAENQTGSFVTLLKTPSTTFLFNRRTMNVDKTFEKITLPSAFRMVLGVNGSFYVVHQTGACRIKSDFSGYEEIEVENFTPLTATSLMMYCEDKDNKLMYVLNDDYSGVYKIELKGEI